MIAITELIVRAKQAECYLSHCQANLDSGLDPVQRWAGFSGAGIFIWLVAVGANSMAAYLIHWTIHGWMLDSKLISVG